MMRLSAAKSLRDRPPATEVLEKILVQREQNERAHVFDASVWSGLPCRKTRSYQIVPEERRLSILSDEAVIAAAAATISASALSADEAVAAAMKAVPKPPTAPPTAPVMRLQTGVPFPDEMPQEAKAP
eukprot:SAG11_NODE_4654_length_1820_cov_0.908193_4_plen_128_part_00